MKTWKLNLKNNNFWVSILIPILVVIFGGNDSVLASQLASKMNSMTTSLVILGQAGCGIGFVFGLIIAGLGGAQLGAYISRSSLIVLVILFLYQPIINQIRSMTGG